MKKNINEGIDEYIENINSVDDLMDYPNHVIVYQRTQGTKDSIKLGGLSREFQNAQAYGYGLYTSLRLSDCIANSEEYGTMILKVWLPGFDRCVIDKGCSVYGGDLAEKVHGKDCSFESQINKLFKPEHAQKILMDGVRSADEMKRYEDFFQDDNVDGVIYNWGGGHWVCIWKDYKKAFPLECSTDKGITFEKLGNETTLKYTLNTWEFYRTAGADKNKYIGSDDYREYNGYFTVHTNQGYNFIDPRKGKEVVSPIWFDFASNVDDEGKADVEYNGHEFYYYPKENTFYYKHKDENGNISDIYLCDPETETLYDDTEFEIGTISDLYENKRTVFGSLLKEVINEYVPDIKREEVNFEDNSGKFVYFYRLGFKDQIDSIQQNSFSKEFRGTGRDNSDWLGSGTYGVQYDPNRISRSYGSIVWKYATPAKLVADTYITPNMHMARKYGIKGTYAEQLQRFFPDLYPQWEKNGKLQKILHNDYSGSAMISNLLFAAFNGRHGESDHFFHSHGVNGILYNGNTDGDAVLTFDDSTIIPVAWKDMESQDKSWHKFEISDNLWNRTYNGYDPLPFLKGTYKEYGDGTRDFITRNYRVENGYLCVCRRKDNKYNYVKAPEGGKNFASPIWFDFASSVDDEGKADVEYNGHEFYYYPKENIFYYKHKDSDGNIIDIYLCDPETETLYDDTEFEIGTISDLL